MYPGKKTCGQDVDVSCPDIFVTFCILTLNRWLGFVIVMHLGYKVSIQCCVFIGHFGESSRYDVSHSLELMNDSVGVRHIGSVGHRGLTELSDHPVYFCLDFLWVRNQGVMQPEE